MHIGVDTRLWQSDDMPELRDFTREVFTRLAHQHPTHQFLFFVDSILKKPTGLPENVTIITLNQNSTNVVMYKWWYDVRLAFTLGKYQAEVFVGTYGLGSIGTTLPQVLIVRDLSFLHKPVYFPHNSYTFYRTFTNFFIKRSKAIATLSQFVKNEIRARYKTNNIPVTTIGSGVSNLYRPLEWKEREAVKERLAAGCEYFVFTGGLHHRANFLHTLKAFSIFKKRQKTNMKLVVAYKSDPAFAKDLEKLNSYKYRSDVVLNSDLTEAAFASAIAGAYAVVFPSFYEGFASHVLAAMNCQVPVITSANSSMAEIAGDAALYADPSSAESIAEQMKLIFKDEHLRNNLIEATKQRAALFSWDKTAELLWQAIGEAVSR